MPSFVLLSASNLFFVKTSHFGFVFYNKRFIQIEYKSATLIGFGVANEIFWQKTLELLNIVHQLSES